MRRQTGRGRHVPRSRGLALVGGEGTGGVVLQDFGHDSLRNCLALRHPRGSIVSSGRPDEAAQRVGGLSSGKSRLHLEEGVSTVGPPGRQRFVASGEGNP
jgi:hypothetical protein